MQVSIKHFETQNHPAMFPEGKNIEFFPIHDDFSKVFNKTIKQNGGSASLLPAPSVQRWVPTSLPSTFSKGRRKSNKPRINAKLGGSWPRSNAKIFCSFVLMSFFKPRITRMSSQTANQREIVFMSLCSYVFFKPRIPRNICSYGF